MYSIGIHEELIYPPRAALVGALSLTALSFAFTAPAEAISVVDWTTSTQGTFVGSPVDGTTVTLSGVNSPLRQNFDASGPNYSPPLSATQEGIRYNVNSDWSATFSSPVSGLLLYAFAWRGAGAGAGVNPVTYTFNQPVVILSGFTGTGTTLSGNTLSIPNTLSRDSGILQFTGPISSFSVTSNATSTNIQGFTIAAVPLETDALPVVGAAAFMAGGIWWKRRRAQAKISDFAAK